MCALKPEDFHISLDELQAAGAKARVKLHVNSRDPLTRFLAVPNHAMFFFTSEDKLLDAYIREHWEALNGLSGEICDIHVSITQLQGDEDAYTQLNDVRSIPGLGCISPAMLPTLHIWSANANLTISLKDVDGEYDKLRDALRNIFDSIYSLGGPITEHWVRRMRNLNDPPGEMLVNGSGQSILSSTAGRDIIQIQHFYSLASHKGGLIMSTSQDGRSDLSRSQTIEDADAGRNISQSTEVEDGAQAIRRAKAASGDISQIQRKTAVMKFLGGSAGGWGIVGLVVALLAWIVYKYLIETS